jgi:hypothetical protein
MTVRNALVVELLEDITEPGSPASSVAPSRRYFSARRRVPEGRPW